MAIQAAAKDGFLEANGLRLHYLEWGDAAVPSIVMLHGLRSSARTWDPVAQPLSAQYRVLALDQRGRGDSDWAPHGDYTRDAFVADLEAFVTQLGLERFVLHGHSMGGANAIVYAAKHPERVRAAIIEDMGPATDPPMPGSARIGRELDATPSSFASWVEAEAHMRMLRPTLSPETLQAVVQSSLKQLPDGTVTWRYDLAGIRAARARPGGQAPSDLWPHVRNLRCPTLVLRGGMSDILSAEMPRAMSEANPYIRWVEIPYASHTVHDDNLGPYNREVARFLQELPPA
ncbi:MAG: hypothetical protein QOF51_3190 [Chloroflexota bacterium]|nr:hypothetical protein [Chloroflexota bacterium]